MVQYPQRSTAPSPHSRIPRAEACSSISLTLVFDTTEERDGVLKCGGGAGMNETYARLDALLARLASS